MPRQTGRLGSGVSIEEHRGAPASRACLPLALTWPACERDHQTPCLLVHVARSGLARFVAANVSIILYTSVMHAGHAAAWENGTLARDHPAWSEVDELGDCTKLYGQCNLSPAGGGVGWALNHTLSVVADIAPLPVAAVMIDNAMWQMGGTFNFSLPAGFEAVAVAGFKAFVGAWFGGSAARYLGVNSTEAAPPAYADRNETAPSPLFGAWKIYRARAYARAAEVFRGRLHGMGVAVLGNTVFWPLNYQYADSEIMQHLDGVVSESHDSSPVSMSIKQELGRVLAQGRPQLNYIATFNQSCEGKSGRPPCRLRGVATVRGMVVASIINMGRPWLVAWGLSTLIDAPKDDPAAAASIGEVSRLMRFRADHFASLFDFGTAGKGAAGSLKLARVGVLASWRHGNQGEDQVSTTEVHLAC